jgi:cell division protein FtsL
MRRARISSAPVLLALLALPLVVAALLAVTVQHRARAQFIELGRLKAQAKELDHEGQRLRIELGRAAQPAAVAAAAGRLGLRVTSGKQTYFVPDSGSGTVPEVAIHQPKPR